jgi:hypothetical protein
VSRAAKSSANCNFSANSLAHKEKFFEECELFYLFKPRLDDMHNIVTDSVQNQVAN